jgi:hypothetical protein
LLRSKSYAGGFALYILGAISPMALAALWLSGPGVARCAQPERPRAGAHSEIQIESGDSVGNFHLLGFAENRRLRLFGIEYDHPMFGRLFGSEFDYVGEVLPVLLLNEPARYGANSLALTKQRQEQYGAGISPIGFRLIWRMPGQIRPALAAKDAAKLGPPRAKLDAALALQMGLDRR